MRHSRMLILLACALPFAACSTSQHAAEPRVTEPKNLANVGTTPAEPGIQATAGDRVICKIVAPTGTRLGERVCMTAAQWEATRSAGSDALNKAQEDGRLRDIPPGG